MPPEVYTSESKALINGLRVQLNRELDRFDGEALPIKYAYTKNTDNLLLMVRHNMFIKDSVLQRFIDKIFQDLIRNTKLQSRPVRVLIPKFPFANAMCVGEGTFMVTPALLARIDNESQLAFTLAHEIAHYELDHIKQRIYREVKTHYVKKTKKGIDKILSEDELAADEAESLRALVYGMTRFSRKQEQDADSLGLLISKNAGYNATESISLLNILDSAEYVRHPLGDKLFESFQFPKYPFQNRWLKPSQTPEVEESSNFLIFSRDSLQQHPSMAIRRKWLQKHLTPGSAPVNKHDTPHTQHVIEIAKFTDLHVAFQYELFDYALWTALSLRNLYEANSYLTTIISRILMNRHPHVDPLGMALNRRYLQKRYKDPELQQVRAFLDNVEHQEAMEIAFNFLNNQNNFDPNDPLHYLLLLTICDITHRETVKARVSEQLRGCFGNTEGFKKNYDKRN